MTSADVKIQLDRCRYFTNDSCFRFPVVFGFGQFKNAVVSHERVWATRFILICRCVGVIVPYIVLVSPSIEPPFLFFYNVGIKGVVEFHSSFSTIHSTIVIFVDNDRFSTFFALLLVVVVILLSTTVAVFVLSNMLVICVVLESLYLLKPSLTNQYKYEVLIRCKIVVINSITEFFHDTWHATNATHMFSYVWMTQIHISLTQMYD